MKTLKAMVPKPRRAIVRPRWQNQTDLGRIGGRSAMHAASNARFERRMTKFQNMAHFGGGLVRLANWLMRKLGLVREFKPAAPPNSYRVRSISGGE